MKQTEAHLHIPFQRIFRTLHVPKYMLLKMNKTKEKNIVSLRKIVSYKL